MVLDDFRLDGQVSIVTGASRGLGFAIAEALAEAGSKLVIASRHEDDLRAAAEKLEPLDVEVVFVAADVAIEPDLDHLVEVAVGEFGRIDVLVNSAGTTARHPAEDFPIDDFDRVMAVNARGLFLLTQKVARVMIPRGGGRIIHIASLQSEIAGHNIPAYAASKGAVRQLTKALAVEWAKYNIRVNAIGPGYFRTDLTEPLQRDAERNAKVLSRIPLNRWGDPEDLKGIAVYLASNASAYVTGQIFYVDGGWLAG